MKQLAAMIRSFPTGVTGLVAAGLLAATMSSIDSGINACSAAYVTDFHKRFSPRTQRGLHLDKGLTLAFGIVSTLLALALIPLVGGRNTLFEIVNKLINGLGSPLLAIILLGMFSRKVNAPGMLYGGIVGLLASLAVSLLVKPLALQYYAALNLLVSVVPCYLFSRIAALGGHAKYGQGEAWTWAAWRRMSDRER
jgi:Na+/proline symporter